MMNLRRLPTTSSRRRLIIIWLLVILLVAVGSYVLWSRHTWMQYTPAYTTRHSSLKAGADDIIKLPATSASEREVINGKLKALASQIDAQQKTICTPHVLVRWQSGIIKSLAEARQACEKKNTSLAEFQKQLVVVTAYSDDDRKLAKILSSAPQANELTEEALAAQSGAWNKLSEAIKAMSVSSSFKPTQQQALEKTLAVKTAWDGLNAAHQTKDKAKYIAAIGVLGVSYDELDRITISSEAAVASLAKGLEARYQKAFH